MSWTEIEQSIADLTGGGMLGKLVVAAVILVGVGIVSHLVVRWVRHLMRRDENVLPQSTFFVNVVRAIVWGLGISLVLDAVFNVNVSALIAALGVGSLAISLGFQDTLQNLIGGTQISFMRIVQPGDNIQVGSNTGVVQDVTWRHATIKNRLGETVIIPNSVLSKNAVVQLPPPERVVVKFVTNTNRDLDDVAEELVAAANITALEFAGVVEEPKVLFTEIAEEGIVGKVIVVIDDASQATPVSDAITRAIAPIVRA